MKQYDLVILGGGSGGIATANRASEYGAKVAVIEGNQLGGTCVNIGCVPKKVTWYASKVNDAINKYGPGYGFEANNVKFDYKKFLEARDGYVSRSRASYNSRFETNGIDVIQGFGRFISDNEIKVNNQIIKADNFMIATGARPYLPDIKGIELVDTSDTFFDWKELPKSVVIVGAGYIGVELAGVLNGLGVETSLYEYFDRPLVGFDHMLSDAILESMKETNLTFVANMSFDEFRKNGTDIECLREGKVIAKAEKIIVATGRKVNSDKIGLENTSIKTDEKGAILVDDNHKTTASNIYAVGDVINKVNLTPVAIRAGRQVAEYLYNDAESGAIDYTNIPSVVFAHPAIGTIGMSEEEAIKNYGKNKIKVYHSKFFSMYTSAASKREACYFKVITLGDEEKVIGLHGTGEGVDEMIQGFGVAIKMGATKKELDSVVAIHPTGAEEFVTMR